MTWTRRSWMSALPSGLWAAGVGEGAWAQSSTPRSVSINITLEPDSLDPTSAPSASVAQVVHYNVLEGLIKIEESGATTGLLAESWTKDPDGRSYTFKLRKGVRFHDGSPLDASVVKFSFERAQALGSANKAKKTLFDNISSIATPDPLTVILTLHHADGNTIFRLGESPAVIVHPATAAQTATKPVGTGPFRFEQWQKGWGITMSKAATYRNASQVKLDRATFRFIIDPEDQAKALVAGDVDVFFNIATLSVSKFQTNNRYQVLIGASSGKVMMAINNRRAPLDDVRVRRAIAHAIDREEFIRAVLAGRGRAIGSHFSPTDAGYVHLAGVLPYDPDKARALLKEAGVKTPLELTMTLPPTPYARNGGPVVAAALAKIGIQVKQEAVDWAQWLSGTFKGNFDLSMINHVEPLDYQIYGDPDYYFGYNSPAFRGLLQRHAEAASARERQMLFGELQRYLANDAVNAWIFAPQISTVARKGLKGLWLNYPIFVHDVGALRWD